MDCELSFLFLAGGLRAIFSLLGWCTRASRWRSSFLFFLHGQIPTPPSPQNNNNNKKSKFSSHITNINSLIAFVSAAAIGKGDLRNSSPFCGIATRVSTMMFVITLLCTQIFDSKRMDHTLPMLRLAKAILEERLAC